MEKILSAEILVDEPVENNENQWYDSQVDDKYGWYKYQIIFPHPFADIVYSSQ